MEQANDIKISKGDLISRSALHQACYRCYEKAMRDAKGEITPMQFNEALLAFEKAIKNAPAVDAVEVVRCKDCDFSFYNECSGLRRCTAPSGMHRFVEDMEFCAWGERRDGE